MTDSLKLNEMQRSSIEIERQRHLANWFIKSSPHMATPNAAAATTTTPTATSTTTTATADAATPTSGPIATTTTATTALSGNGGNAVNGHNHGGTAAPHQSASRHHSSGNGIGAPPPPPVLFRMSSNGSGHVVNGGKHSSNGAVGISPPPPAATAATAAAIGAAGAGALGHLADGRKPKLRRFNWHDTSVNMFSVADFENARLARRNQNEMRRMRQNANGSGYGGSAGSGLAGISGSAAGLNGASGCGLTGSGCGSLSGDYSTGDSKASKYSNESQHEPLPADIFLERYSLPRVVRISYKTKFCDETLQSSSSNGSSTATSMSTSSAGGPTGLGTSHNGVSGTPTGTGTSSSTASSSGNINNATATNTSSSGGGAGSSGSKHVNSANSSNNNNNNNSSSNNNSTTISNGTHDAEHEQDQGELFLLYRLIRQRHIYHGYNAKTAAASRKKGVLIPQEFPGYFSLLNDKGLPTATLYTSLIQLVRERVYKFVSVDNMPGFTESQPNAVTNPPTDGCLPIYTSPPPPPSNTRPQYVKTTARGGQVFRLLAVYEDGKQEHNAIGCTGGVAAKPSTNHGREKEKGRYAQLLNENRQVLYVPLSTKGKFYEIEPGVPQILQKLVGGHDAVGAAGQKKINPDCVHRITALVTPARDLPQTLRYISGPSGAGSANTIPESVCITRIHTEHVIIACPIEDVCGSGGAGAPNCALQLRKLHLTKEMNLLKSSLGFESEQRMLANPNVQNILKFCQFNCDQLLKMVEVEVLQRPERSGSKSRVDGLKILKPLHLPKLLRREKTTIPAHEKEDSIIFLSKTDLANLEAKDSKEPKEAQAVYESAAAGSRISDKMKVFQSTKKKWFRKQDKHAAHTLTAYELDVQAKRMSMERYTDMSKLLQERFGDKPNMAAHEHESHSERSGTSDIGCSDTETTTLATIDEKLKKLERSGGTKLLLQKSMSLQDIELIGGGAVGGKPDLLASHAADTISEAGTDLEDLENQAPLPQSFITEKLYNEFHVKTRQYSKSSSSLHQLLNFSLPQKMQLHDNKRSLAQLKAHNKGAERRLDFSIGEPVTGRRAAGGLSLLAGASASHSQHASLMSPLTPTSLIDDLPYSSVRDSLVLSSDESAGSEHVNGNVCQALHLIDYTKENIYAEICHDANGVATVLGAGMHTSNTRDTFSSETHSTQLSDDYGDYASLTYPTPPLPPLPPQQQTHAQPTANGHGHSSGTGNAISRVQINCSSSPVSYHTVYLGDEPLGEQHHTERARRDKSARATASDGGAVTEVGSRDRAHITTVALEGGGGSAHEAPADNIYNTLK